MYRSMLTTRGIEERGHILYKQGKIPGSFYTGRGNEASAVGVGERDGPGRRRVPVAARHGRPHHPRRRAVAHLRAVHGARRRPHPRARRQRPHRRCPARAACDGQPSAGHASRRGRDGARVQDPGGAPRRDGLVRRGRCRPRRRARGHESRRRAPASGRVRDRQQPVGVLDPGPSRPRGRAPRRPGGGLRVRGRRRRRHRRARGLPRGQARDREGARRWRPDPDRVRDAAHGRSRRPRRRVLRAARDVRGVGAARPDRAVPHLAARQRLDDRWPRRTRSRRASRSCSTTRSRGRRSLPCPTRPRSSTASTRRRDELETPHHK